MPFSEEEERVRSGDPEFFPCIKKLFFMLIKKYYIFGFQKTQQSDCLLYFLQSKKDVLKKKIQFPTDTETGLKAIKLILVNQYAFS